MNKLIFAILMLFAADVYSCTCISLKEITIKESYKDASTVLLGKIISVDTINIVDTIENESEPSLGIYEIYRDQRLVYKIEVLEYFKVNKFFNFKTNYIVTTAGEATCSAKFLIGETYIVFYNIRTCLGVIETKKAPFLATSSCKKNQLASESIANQLRKMRSGRKNIPKGNASAPKNK